MSRGEHSDQGAESVSALGDVVARSSVVSIVRRIRDRLSAVLIALSAAVVRAYEGSIVGRADRWLVRQTRRSVLYRWLAAEPEPTLIAVDLRTSVLVGPVVGRVDRWSRSEPAIRVRRRASRLRSSVVGAVRRAPVRLASAGLLAFAGTALVRTWTSTGTDAPVALVALTVVSAIGLGAGVSASDLASVRVVRIARAAFAVPDAGSRQTAGPTGDDPSTDGRGDDGTDAGDDGTDAGDDGTDAGGDGTDAGGDDRE